MTGVRTQVFQQAAQAPASTLPICRPLIQPKLKIGAPDDQYEREADRVAAGISDCRLQNADCTAPERRGGSTEPLHDFSKVRIHADEPAARAAAALNARAFTVGSHVVFGRGEYAPETPPGQQLLAHELTHVAQQAAGAASGVQRRLVVNPAEGRVYSDPADPRTQKLDDLEGYLQELSPSVTVDRAGAEPEVHGPDVCPSPTRTTDRCLCDLSAATNTWEVRINDYAYPHTSGPRDPAEAGLRYVSVFSTLTPMQTGAWGGGEAAGTRIMQEGSRVLGHELCGHAWLMQRGVHPDAEDVTKDGQLMGRPQHDPTIRIENRVAEEMAARPGGSPYVPRGTYESPHGGESFMHVAVWGYPLGNPNPYALPADMQKRLNLVRTFSAKEKDSSRPLYMDVVGHADHVGSAAANERVAQARADNVVKYVGLPKARALVREGRSDTECPPGSGENPACRRVELYMYKYALSSETHPESGEVSDKTKAEMTADEKRVRDELGDVME